MPTTVTSSSGTVYHLFQGANSVKTASIGIGFTELRNNLGNGFRSQVLYGSSTGLRHWKLTLPTLADTSVLPNTYTGVNAESLSREMYIWDLYCNTRITGEPFAYQCPRDGRYYLVDFKDDSLEYSQENMYVKLYSTGVEIEQVREDGETIYAPQGLSGITDWYTRAEVFPETLPFPVTSGWRNTAEDDGAVDGASVTGDVISVAAQQNGHAIVRFNNTTNNGLLTRSGGPFVIKEAFVVMKMREATFSNFAGIISGQAAPNNVALVGDSGTTKFTNLALSGSEYRLNNALLAASNQQAPMNVYGIVHIRYPTGVAITDNLQIGKDRDIAGRFAEADIGEIIIFDALQSRGTVLQIYEYLSIKWDIAIVA